MTSISLNKKDNKKTENTLSDVFIQSLDVFKDIENSSIQIVKNFELILAFFKDKNLPVSKNKLFVTPKDLLVLNKCLLNPTDIDIDRPQPSSLPHVNAVLWLLRTIKILTISRIKNKLFMHIDNIVLNEWHDLSCAERYFTLLDAWLAWAKESMITDRYRWDSACVFNCMGTFSSSFKDLKVQHTESYKYLLGEHNLALFEMFGFIQIIHERPLPGKGWNYSYAQKTELGRAIFAIISKAFESEPDSFREVINDGTKYKSFSKLQPYLQKQIPIWKNSLSVKRRNFIAGIYTFTVILGRNKRELFFDSKETLYSLSHEIISEFNLGFDHLYRFICKDNSSGITINICHDDMEDEQYFVSEFKIGYLPLYCGEEMIFHYDFGDDIKFRVFLDKIEVKNV